MCRWRKRHEVLAAAPFCVFHSWVLIECAISVMSHMPPIQCQSTLTFSVTYSQRVVWWVILHFSCDDLPNATSLLRVLFIYIFPFFHWDYKDLREKSNKESTAEREGKFLFVKYAERIATAFTNEEIKPLTWPNDIFTVYHVNRPDERGKATAASLKFMTPPRPLTLYTGQNWPVVHFLATIHCVITSSLGNLTVNKWSKGSDHSQTFKSHDNP